MNVNINRYLKSKTVGNTLFFTLLFCIVAYVQMVLISLYHSGSLEASPKIAGTHLAIKAWSDYDNHPEFSKKIIENAKIYNTSLPYVLQDAIKEREVLNGQKISSFSLDEISKMDFSWRNEIILEAITRLDDVELGSYLHGYQYIFDSGYSYGLTPNNPDIALYRYFESRTNFNNEGLDRLKDCYDRVWHNYGLRFKLSLYFGITKKGSCVDLFFEDKKTQKEDLFLIKSKGNKL